MKDQILAIVKQSVGEDVAVELVIPDDAKFGHYATNVAMRLAKAQGKKPLELAGEIAAKILADAPAGFFERVEAAVPGFVNFWLSKKTLQDALVQIAHEENFNKGTSMQGKMVMVEFTDANPFKLFHIGHLMSNTIGESLSRLHEAAGARVHRANYYGDVGMHIAKSLWGMQQLASEMPGEHDSPLAKMEFLGRSYAAGSKAYEEDESAKQAMVEMNKKIYNRSDEAVNKLYDLGLAWSLSYFETIYQRLGTKFDDYFPESSVARTGADLVLSRKDIFTESEGAIIFPGEKYGLHTRVFINSQGLPTYEAKELSLNKKKFELYSLDLSIIVTGNEIIDYFKVLLKAMELVLPDVAMKTRHAPHGMLRLASGKMSSRTGDVVTAESLIDQVKAKVRERVNERNEMTEAERETAAELIAIGAIKYSILKQNPGQDIIFDFERSLSLEGDSGPYLQYAYARLRSILRKANADLGAHVDAAAAATAASISPATAAHLDSENELALVRKISEFPDVVSCAVETQLPSSLVTYLHKLAAVANKFYETTPILKDDNAARRDARLALVEIAAKTLQSGLALLGIRTLEKI